MRENINRFTLRTGNVLLKKLHFIAQYEGRSANKELEQMIKKRIAEFEKTNGEIEINSETKSS
jgi:hypothetical protein